MSKLKDICEYFLDGATPCPLAAQKLAKAALVMYEALKKLGLYSGFRGRVAKQTLAEIDKIME